jgi:hypothetical protein
LGAAERRKDLPAAAQCGAQARWLRSREAPRRLAGGPASLSKRFAPHPVLWRPMGSRVCGVWTRSLRRDQAPRGAVWRTDSDDAARAAGCALVCASTCRPCSAQRCMCRFRVVGRSIITSRRWSRRREAEVVPHAASTGWRGRRNTQDSGRTGRTTVVVTSTQLADSKSGRTAVLRAMPASQRRARITRRKPASRYRPPQGRGSYVNRK